MTYPQGVAFRATSGYVTDGADDWGETATTANYPTTTPQGNNVGWETAPSGTRDRDSGIDARLAGIHFAAFFTPFTYRFDLDSTGEKSIRCAAGDATSNNSIGVEVFDTSSSLGVLVTDLFASAGNFDDAADAAYSAANWPGSNSPVTKTFTTTICRFGCSPNASNTYVIAYLRVENAQPVLNRGMQMKSAPRVKGKSSSARFGETNIKTWF